MTPERLDPAAPRSGVKHSTTETLRSHLFTFAVGGTLNTNNVDKGDNISVAMEDNSPVLLLQL